MGLSLNWLVLVVLQHGKELLSIKQVSRKPALLKSRGNSIQEVIQRKEEYITPPLLILGEMLIRMVFLKLL